MSFIFLFSCLRSITRLDSSLGPKVKIQSVTHLNEASETNFIAGKTILKRPNTSLCRLSLLPPPPRIKPILTQPLPHTKTHPSPTPCHTSPKPITWRNRLYYCNVYDVFPRRHWGSLKDLLLWPRPLKRRETEKTL